jgi:hypothetical protein
LKEVVWCPEDTLLEHARTRHTRKTKNAEQAAERAAEKAGKEAGEKKKEKKKKREREREKGCTSRNADP